MRLQYLSRPNILSITARQALLATTTGSVTPFVTALVHCPALVCMQTTRGISGVRMFSRTTGVHRTTLAGAPPVPASKRTMVRLATAWPGLHPITIDENNAAQNTTVIYASTTTALWKVRPQTLHLRRRKPV